MQCHRLSEWGAGCRVHSPGMPWADRRAGRARAAATPPAQLACCLSGDMAAAPQPGRPAPALPAVLPGARAAVGRAPWSQLPDSLSQQQLPRLSGQAVGSGFPDTHSWSPVSLQRDLKAAGAVVTSKSAYSPLRLPAWAFCFPVHFPVASSCPVLAEPQGALWPPPSRRAEQLSWGDTDPHGDFLRKGAAGRLHRLRQGRWLLYVVFKNVAMLSFFQKQNSHPYASPTHPTPPGRVGC